MERVREPGPSFLASLQREVIRLNRWIALAVFAFAAALLVFLTATLFLQVLFRYVIKAPLPWTEEAARFALVWYGMLASAAGAWSGQHFIFRWATLVLGERARLVLRLVVSVLTLMMVGLLIKLSWSYLSVFAGQTATATYIDMRIPFAGIPVGLSCFFVIYFLDLVDGICALRTGTALSVREIRENWVYRQLKREPARK